MEKLCDELINLINEQDFCFDPAEWKSLRKALARFKKYEDLGFTPEEIAYMAKFYKDHTSAEAIADNMHTVAKLMELAKWKGLEDQERILILPCKIGTPVYTITFYNCLNGKCCWFKEGKCSKEQTAEYCPQEVIEQKYSLTMFRDGDKVFLNREEAEANVGVLRVTTEVK